VLVMARFTGTVVGFWSLVLLIAATAFAKNGEAQQPLVFRSGTREVLVDIVVTDAGGKPAHGLKAQDFQVFDDGKGQTVRSFEEHTPDQPRAASHEKQPVLGPGVYSNWTPAPPSGAVNIILFDTLNLEWQDQAYARRKMIEYLKTLPHGQEVALFTLGARLRMVQSITGDTDTLIAAANELGALSSFRTDTGESQSIVLEQMGTAPVSIASASPEGGQSAAVAVMQGPPPGVHSAASILEDFLKADEREIGDLRMRITLEALRDLARSLGSIPGRKNLIWVSGNFPALMGVYTELSGLQAYDRELRATAALLAAHQIAVYPIDARGLLVGPAGVGADSTGRELLRNGSNTQNAYAKGLSEFSRGLQASHNSMDELAEQTGGRAFYNSNDISSAIGKSIDFGANYYTLSYTPTNKNWDGRLRKIEVKVARQNVKLTYRRGYYAVADPFAPVLNIKTTKVDVEKRLIEAVQPNSPQLTGIQMQAKVVTSGAGKPIEIEYVIDARDLTLSFSENGTRKVSYELVVVAWDNKENNAGQAWEMVDKDISSQEANEILRGAIHSHRFLSLEPGDYRLYLGIIDVESKKIGTLVIPLKVSILRRRT
jgi:VWFA-related protein